MDDPDITQLPQAPKASQPDSGTYGIKAAADRLQQGMTPAPGPPPPGTEQSGPPISTLPGSARPQVSSGPFGLPPAITSPTQQPNVPVGTPLAAAPSNPVATAGAADQQRLAFLDMLARNPDVSDVTREFAQTMLAKLIQRSKQ